MTIAPVSGVTALNAWLDGTVTRAQPAKTAGPADDRSSGVVSGAAGKADAYKDFESFLLKTFVEAILPKENEAVFGKGVAGSVWKSMLSEKVADEIAESGVLGIAEQLAGKRGASPRSAAEGIHPLTSTPETES